MLGPLWTTRSVSYLVQFSFDLNHISFYLINGCPTTRIGQLGQLEFHLLWHLPRGLAARRGLQETETEGQAPCLMDRTRTQVQYSGATQSLPEAT